jgi:hypothetical protein
MALPRIICADEKGRITKVYFSSVQALETFNRADEVA